MPPNGRPVKPCAALRPAATTVIRLPQSESFRLAQQTKSRAKKKTGRGTPAPRPHGRIRRWSRRILLVLTIIVFLPIALAPLYRVPALHPVSMLMVKDLVTLQGYRRDWVAFEDMGTVLPYSVVMSEDGRYCSHGGVDWGALNTVVQDALAGEGLRGASTISMQTVKNLFLWHGRSYVRKALEVPLALYFDAVVPKQRILEIYLNIAEWGPNIYGAEAAAQHYFGRPANALTRRQAALLAVTLPNPGARDPANPGSGLSNLAAIVERRAQQAGDYVGCLR